MNKLWPTILSSPIIAILIFLIRSGGILLLLVLESCEKTHETVNTGAERLDILTEAGQLAASKLGALLLCSCLYTTVAVPSPLLALPPVEPTNLYISDVLSIFAAIKFKQSETRPSRKATLRSIPCFGRRGYLSRGNRF